MIFKNQSYVKRKKKFCSCSPFHMNGAKFFGFDKILELVIKTTMRKKNFVLIKQFKNVLEHLKKYIIIL